MKKKLRSKKLVMVVEGSMVDGYSVVEEMER